MKIDFVVFYSENIEHSKDFYELLGLSFKKEKHGEGPEHYAAELGGVVLEIYPSKWAVPSESIGFSVWGLDSIIDKTKNYVLKRPQKTPFGRIASMVDPDGRKVFLREL